MRVRSLLAAATVSLIATTLAGAPVSAADAPYKVLVFSKTAGFRHSSIPDGIAAIQTLGAANNSTVAATEDAAAFTAANLAQFQKVVFLSTTGDHPITAKGALVRVSSAGAGGTIEFRAGSQTGALLGAVAVSNTGSWDTFREASIPVAANPATSVYLVFHGGSRSLIDVDEFTLHNT